MKRTFSTIGIFIVPLLFLLVAGCATVPKAPPVFRPGTSVDSLTASVGLSVKTPAGGTGGNGYLVYRRPGMFRMVMLTPFGTTALDFGVRGDKVTIAIPSRGTAYTGAFGDLPEQNGLQAWRLMQWAVEGDPLFDVARAGKTVRSEAGGRKALAFYDGAGLLERKLTEDGNEVRYLDYQSAEGVPIPSTMLFNDVRGISVKITLKEPEVNQPLEDAALSPQMAGLNVLPLSEFRGM